MDFNLALLKDNKRGNLPFLLFFQKGIKIVKEIKNRIFNVSYLNL